MASARRSLRLWTMAVVLALVCIVAPQVSASVDQYAGALWGMKKVRAEAAWAKGAGQGVTVAVIDSGVDLTHEDLKSNLVPGYDFVDDDNDPRDESGHGTHVAGIIAAVANNGVGVAGVAPEAKIMPVRVLNEEGSGSQADIEAGVRWAVAHGAKVVNMSLGADVIVEFLTGGTLSNAVNYAWSHGVIAVISAGNDQLFRSELRNAKAIVVTATTPDDRKAPYATGVGFAEWGMAAPGGTSEAGEKGMILSTFWDPEGRRYAYLEGTSMAAPHVAGAAAILRGMGLSPQQTVNRLLSTAKDLGAQGKDSVFGHGRLDVAAAAQGQPGPEGEPGRTGSSAEGSSATGAPGSNASGTRGAPGDVPRPRRVLPSLTPSATPTISPTVRPTPTRVAVETSEGRGSVYAAMGAGAAAAGAVVLAAVLKRRYRS